MRTEINAAGFEINFSESEATKAKALAQHMINTGDCIVFVFLGEGFIKLRQTGFANRRLTNYTKRTFLAKCKSQLF
tara:strand:+ start:151 stop:378 length:228 start_codon:yes stop_codon:yes gene_type:complete